MPTRASRGVQAKVDCSAPSANSIPLVTPRSLYLVEILHQMLACAAFPSSLARTESRNRQYHSHCRVRSENSKFLPLSAISRDRTEAGHQAPYDTGQLWPDALRSVSQCSWRLVCSIDATL